MSDALRLMLGTLTALPVPAPGRVDRPTAGLAMALAPLGGLLLALLTAGPLLAAEHWSRASPFLLAALAVAALAALTRALHLDGLADTADGLGSGRRGESALRIMKQSDIGPFGVATLVLTLLVQVAALAELVAAGAGAASLALALVVSRAVLPLLCTPRFPAARTDGLGAGVAGSVTPARAVAALALMLLLAAGAGWAMLGGDADTRTSTALALAVPAGLVAGALLAVHARRRFGGVTGDVYGAAVETAFAACLVVAALIV